jgi:hypothetical protein
MSKSNRLRPPGTTEEEWLACADPLRMPKNFGGRASSRKRCLLACAYALHAPGAYTSEPARRIIEAVQSAAMAFTSGTGFQDGTRAAVLRVFPESAGMTRWNAWSQLYRHKEFGTEGGTLAHFLSGFVYEPPTTAAVNSVATVCLATVRANANREMRPVLDGILQKHGRIVTDALKEDVFSLIPEPDRARVRAGTWLNNWLPARIRNKVYAVVSRPRIAAACAAMADLVREVFGNPYRVPKIEPEWLLWNHGAVRQIGEQIASTGNFADMPILADALEDAGCTDEYLLRHCREERTHVPGCWALDAVLGRA